MSIRLEDLGEALYYYVYALEVQDRGWPMSKPLEAERISHRDADVSQSQIIES